LILRNSGIHPESSIELKPQQIQRYEANDYQTASLARLLEIARVLNLRVRERAELVQK
jgi:hypothetical protein